MRAEETGIQSDTCDPSRYQPGVLSRCHASILVTPASKEKLARFLAGVPDVVVNGLPGLLGQFESDGMSGFPLPDSCAIPCEALWSDVLDFKADDITAPELAVYREVEHGEVSGSTLDLQLGSDRPDMFSSQRRFGA